MSPCPPVNKRFRRVALILLKPKGYNDPRNFNMLWNQWPHQGYLWGWYSYEQHAKWLREIV